MGCEGSQLGTRASVMVRSPGARNADRGAPSNLAKHSRFGRRRARGSTRTGKPAGSAQTWETPDEETWGINHSFLPSQSIVCADRIF